MKSNNQVNITFSKESKASFEVTARLQLATSIYLGNKCIQAIKKELTQLIILALKNNDQTTISKISSIQTKLDHIPLIKDYFLELDEKFMNHKQDYFIYTYKANSISKVSPNLATLIKN